MDTTYWGTNFGVCVMRDAYSKIVLWHKFVKHERLLDYSQGVAWLEEKGFIINGIVCDGLKGIFNMFSQYKVQLCQFHQVKTVIKYITRNPKMEASKELKELMLFMKKTDKESFIGAFDQWCEKWDRFLKEKHKDPLTGKSRYIHRKLRSAYLSVKRNMPWLWTFYDYYELSISNTNNALEGYFTNLKTKLRSHNGLSIKNRKRFIIEFFSGIERPK